jgi:hypothetical protein
MFPVAAVGVAALPVVEVGAVGTSPVAEAEAAVEVVAMPGVAAVVAGTDRSSASFEFEVRVESSAQVRPRPLSYQTKWPSFISGDSILGSPPHLFNQSHVSVPSVLLRMSIPTAISYFAVSLGWSSVLNLR